jgi:AcrR family transcriptional regulator
MSSSRTPGEPYRRLSPRAHGLDPEGVARDQRDRLRGAIVRLVCERGLLATSVSDLTRLSRVSRLTFYELYADKQECFLDAFDEIAARASSVVLDALGRAADAGTVGGRLSADDALRVAVRAFLQLAASEPQAVLLLLLGTLGGGPPGLERRNEQLLATVRRVHAEHTARSARADRAGESAAPPVGPLDPTVQIVIGGIREAIARRIREDRAQELADLAEELVAWALSYPAAAPASLIRRISMQVDRQAAGEERPAPASAPEELSARPSVRPGGLPSGRHELSRELVAAHQRERIVEAIAATLAEHGHSGLTVAEIARRAGVSHRTFYEHFPDKWEAFLAAGATSAQRSIRSALSSYAAHPDQWPAAVPAAIEALLETMASEPSRTMTGFTDMFGAGPQGLALRDGIFDALAKQIEAETRQAGHARSPLVSEACVGGVWELIREHLAQRPIDELPSLAPQVVYAVLTPYLGADQAASLASGAGRRGRW